jgi:hypothetical protein
VNREQSMRRVEVESGTDYPEPRCFSPAGVETLTAISIVAFIIP